MMFDVKNLSNIDYFFYYGYNPLEDECAHDLYELALQPKKSMFYNRGAGAGVIEYENAPDAISLQVGLRYSLANAISKRNATVTDGRNNTIDRRILASQGSIVINQNGTGNIDIEIFYFLFADSEAQVQNLNMPTGNA